MTHQKGPSPRSKHGSPRQSTDGANGESSPRPSRSPTQQQARDARDALEGINVRTFDYIVGKINTATSSETSTGRCGRRLLDIFGFESFAVDREKVSTTRREITAEVYVGLIQDRTAKYDEGGVPCARCLPGQCGCPHIDRR